MEPEEKHGMKMLNIINYRADIEIIRPSGLLGGVCWPGRDSRVTYSERAGWGCLAVGKAFRQKSLYL